jgi:photosystem II stability/assembly factor-like uncharacterized protein
MNNDESFDREVKATLERMAGEPAPDRLAARVAAIPSETPAATTPAGRAGPPFRGVVSGLAAIAAVVALAVAAIVLRPAVVPQTGDASANPTFALPSTEPSSALSSAKPTPKPTPTVAPTSTPTAQPLADVPVPTGFRPMSVTFVSTQQGWVLGSMPCATGRCPAIARTIDGGKAWTSINAPETTIGQPAVDVSPKGITGIRFADLRDGWAFGPELWATHDGGKTWKRLDILSGGAIVALASSRGTVHAVAYDGGVGNYRIASAPVGGDAWSTASLKLPVGAGPVPVVQLVLSGEGGWILENDRTVVAGARLVGGTWRTWQPPCADAVGPAFLGASSATDLAAACDVGAWSNAQGDHLFVSRDGGVSFIEIGKRNPTIDSASGLATPNRSTIVVAGYDSHGSVLTGSFDSGHSWTVVDRPTSVSLTDLGFTSPAQGVVIATASSGASHLLVTRDGGHTWSIVKF